MQKGRIRQPTHSQQTHCKIFNDCTRGSDPWRGWNTAERKCALKVLLAGTYTKGATEQPMHLNRNKTQEIHRNTLRNFPLQGFNKHLPWFRCSGKGEHLNRDKTQKIHRNSFRNFPLRGFNKHLPWFRCRAEEKKQKITFLRGITL